MSLHGLAAHMNICKTSELDILLSLDFHQSQEKKNP